MWNNSVGDWLVQLIEAWFQAANWLKLQHAPPAHSRSTTWTACPLWNWPAISRACFGLGQLGVPTTSFTTLARPPEVGCDASTMTAWWQERKMEKMFRSRKHFWRPHDRKSKLKTAESPLSWSIFNCTIDIRWPGLLSLGLLIIHVWPTCFQCRAGRKPSRTKIDAPSSCSSVIPRLALQTAAQHELYFSQ